MLPAPARLGLGGTLSLLASSTNEMMSTARLLTGRLPDERAITDQLFVSIAGRVGGSRALVDLRSRERDTGADALLIIGYASGAIGAYALQAKVLASHVQGKPQTLTPTPNYPALGHVAKGNVRQYDQLLKSCAAGGDLAGWTPVHLFYNELVATVTGAPWTCRSVFPGDSTELGVTFARTEDVKVLADARLALKLRGGGRGRFPLSLVSTCSRPWLCLLCADRQGPCVGRGNAWPPPPVSPRGERLNPEGAEPDGGFDPAPWPDGAEEPDEGVTSSEGARLAEALLSLVRQEPTEGALIELREHVRRLARSALVIDIAVEE